MDQKNLRKLLPCEEGLAYAESFSSLQEAWDKCARGDWMLWLLGRLSRKPNTASRKKLVLTSCACIRLSLKHVPAGEERPRRAIETAERWARNAGPTLQEVAYAAVNAAVNAAAYAANSAATAAYFAANTAAAATAAAVARQKTLKECADIVRSFYPKAPKIRGPR